MKRILAMVLVWLLLAGAAQASVALNGSFSCLVDKNGDTLIAPHVYSAIIRLKDGLFAARSTENGKFGLINEQGEALTAFSYSEFALLSGGILFSEGGKYGVMDEAFQTVVPAEYTWLIENGRNGYLALRTDVWDDSPDGVYMIDETGYVSPTGVKVASFLMDFRDGLSPALSTDNGRYGYLNGEGQWEIRPQYAYADEFAGGIAIASLDSGSGVIDKSGRWRITPKYDFISISEGENALIAAVSYKEGVTVFSAESFEETCALNEETQGAYVSVGGKSVIAYLTDRVVRIGWDGRVLASVEGDGYIFPLTETESIIYDQAGAHLVDENGNTLITGVGELDFLFRDAEKSYFMFSDFSGSMKVGVMDDAGNILIDCEFDHISVPENGYFAAENASGVTLFDALGGIVWQYSFS